MRVLQVSPAYYPATVYGGPIFSVHYTCQALAREGLVVDVATTNANGGSRLDVPTDRPVFFEPNYVVRYHHDTIIGKFSSSLMVALPRAVRSAQVVHLQDIYWVHAVEALVLCLVLSKPVVISPRGVLSAWAMSTRKPLLKRVWMSLLIGPLTKARSRVAWHATSADERQEILKVVSHAVVHVVPNAIDCMPFDSARRLERKEFLARFFPGCVVSPERARVLVGLGRLHRKKSFDVAIGALGLIREEFADAVLLIAGGDDGERRNLEAMIDKASLSERVCLVGELSGENKAEFLKGADLFLFPSHNENFGLACLEALASRLPVVASRHTPWSAIESEGVGRWVDNTPEAFAQALRELLPLDLARMGELARAHAVRFDLPTLGKSLRGVYEGVNSGREG